MKKTVTKERSVVLSYKVVTDVSLVATLNATFESLANLEERFSTNEETLWGQNVLQTVKLFEIYTALLTHEELLNFLIAKEVLVFYMVWICSVMLYDDITALQAFRKALNEKHLDAFIAFTGKEGKV